MNIKEQKKNFLNLLRMTYKAKGHVSILSNSYITESLGDYEQEKRIKIKENILRKYGFDGSDFWEIVCPSLKEEGYIEDFGDPNNIPAKYYKRFIEYEKLQKKLKSSNKRLPDKEMKETEKKYAQLMGFARNSYPFFILNKNKLFNEKKSEELKSAIVLPVKTEWEDISMKWINSNDVEITLRNDEKYKKIFDFKELGFYDEKRKCPNLGWKTLQGLSSNTGKMSWGFFGGKGETEADILRKIEAFQKRKSNLSKHLMKMFGINKDPFHTFSKEKEYIIRIKLIPERRKREDKKEESWEDLLSEDEIERWKIEAKKDFIKNPNQEECEDD